MATGRIGTTPVLTTRWSKAPAAGTTSLSGLDDNSVSLVYSVGYEQVYLNGALLSRTNDYTATNGTSITLTNATVAGDIVEVFANATIALTDTYTQSQANGKFINNTLTTTTGDIIYASAANTPARLGIGSTDQVLKVSGGVPTWGAGGLTFVTSQTFSSVASVTFTSCFTSSYVSYLIVFEDIYAATGADDLQMQWRYGTTTETGASYYGSCSQFYSNSATTSTTGYRNAAQMTLSNALGGTGQASGAYLFAHNLGQTGRGMINGQHYASDVGNEPAEIFGGGFAGTSRVFDGFVIKSSSSNITGTIRVYGLAKS